MKIRVALKIKTNPDFESTVDLVVGSSETVESVKEKVATTQLVPFPDQELILDGKVLENGAKLSASGVQDGSSLSFEIKASESTLAQQLAEMLKARDLSPDELSLLYCYKHGVSVNQALKLLGFDGKLQDFVNKQKCLSLENGSVAFVREDAALKPFSVVDEIVKILKASNKDTMDIKDLSSKFVEKFGVSLSSIVGGRPGDFLAKEKTFALHGKGLVSLAGTKKAVSPPPAVASPPGIAAPPGLGGKSEESLLDVLQSVRVDKFSEVDNEQYLELHNKICSRPFNSKITQVLNDLVAAISETTFLEIDHVVTGGSVARGTAISGDASADIVLFLGGVTATKQETWLPSLLKAVAASLSEEFQAAHNLEAVHISEESIQMKIRGPTPCAVGLYLSPTFESYAKTIEAINDKDPDSRKICAPSFAKERTQFVSRQPSSVKVTMRLVKWWRDQQEWYGRLARPSDEVLELAAIYSAIQTKPADQKIAIANLMSLLSRFDQMRVVWSNYYNKDDVWKPLLRQRPLLMDPTNPFVNVADPKVFDPSELMSLARTTFFW
jgi:hypothetical protein